MGLCSQWQKHLCQSLNHLWGHLSFPFLEGQDMATARHLYCSLSKGSEICLPLFYPRSVPPVAQAGCISAGATPFLFLSSANMLTGSMSHTVISLSNDYSATPLLLSPENVFSFFFFQHGYTDSITSIQVLVSFCSPILYFLYGILS